MPVGVATHPATGASLPIGLHLLGAPWTEHKLLRLGVVLDEYYGGDKKANPDTKAKVSGSTYFVEGLLEAMRPGEFEQEVVV